MARPDAGTRRQCPPRGAAVALPLAPRRDRWCWCPDVGFHDRIDPARTVVLRVGTALLPGGRAVSARQAAELGAGGALPPVAAGFCGLDQWVRFDDATPFARLGHASLQLEQALGRDPSTTDSDNEGPFLRGVVVGALGRIEPGGLPAPWRRPLAVAAAERVDPQELARLEDVCDAAYRRLTRFTSGWPPPVLDRQAWWDYAAARTCVALSKQDWDAAAQAVTDLYGQTRPSRSDAVDWLDSVSAALTSVFHG
ncbi:hypothetical protein QEZ54_20640 [Catellatospora sp. KI3]|uniref:hypothetical protein n=1 Tax=Catellatospora sp. KI3 TaxID=3041620 RepID=UPI002483296E|nr:hypothetical protein [Catellatospora sp. KI3]MDI1463392.1 hypothetical protein [Catellatospora sp. KI3]